MAIASVLAVFVTGRYEMRIIIPKGKVMYAIWSFLSVAVAVAALLYFVISVVSLRRCVEEKFG